MQDGSRGRGALAAAAVLAVGAVLSAVVLGAFLYASRAQRDTIQTVGAATERFEADVVKWRVSLAREVGSSGLSEGYRRIGQDVAMITDRLRGAGLPDSALSLQPATANPIYSQNGVTGYNVVQAFFVLSTDVDAVEALALNPADLLGEGIILQGSQLEYYYADLDNLKRRLLAAATTDARARAGEIAGSAGAEVGSVVTARAGVFQITEPFSTEVASYGVYSTGTRQKEITVTVHATFRLE